MVEPLGCDADLFLIPPLLVKNPSMLLVFPGLGDPQDALGFAEKLDVCFKPSSNVFSLSFNFS